MVDKTKLIKEIKALCLVELDNSKMKLMTAEQLEEFKQDLINSGATKNVDTE